MTMPIPFPDASHSMENVSEKSVIGRIGEVVIASCNVVKALALSCVALQFSLIR